MLIFLRVVGVACFPLSMAARFEKFPRSISRRPSSIRRSGTRESNRGEKRRNESRLRMLDVYICIYIPGKSCGSISKCGSFGRNAYLGGALAVLSCTRFPPRSLRSSLDLDPPLSLLSLASRRFIRFFFEKRDAVQDPPSSSIIFLSHPFHRYRVRLNKFIRKIGNREQRFQYGGVPSYNRVVDVYSRSFLRFREFSYRFE